MQEIQKTMKACKNHESEQKQAKPSKKHKALQKHENQYSYAKNEAKASMNTRSQ